MAAFFHLEITLELCARIIGLFGGTPETRWEGKAPSAIRKQALAGKVNVSRTGLVGDSQADLSVHGGPEKALHFYSADHHAHWAETFPDAAFEFAPGCFGENISAFGINEEDTHIGDVFSLGTARVQVSLGRQPCWKLNLHTGIPAMAPSFQRTQKTGWYFRVLEEGVMEAGDEMKLLERPCDEWPLKKVIAARFDPRLDPQIARDLAELPLLAENWRQSFAKKMDTGFQEDTSKRLLG